MPLLPLKFKPGLNREVTRNTNEGGWYDMDKVRFRFGFPEKINGWLKRSTSQQFAGRCRALTSWVDLRKERFIGIGTNLKYYIDRGTTLFDITPIRKTFTTSDVVDITIDYTSNSGLPALQSSIGDTFVSIGPITVTGVSATGTGGSPIGNTNGTPLPDNSAVIRNLSVPGATGEIGNTVGIAEDIFSFYVTGVDATSSLGTSYYIFRSVEEDDLTFSATIGDRTITATTSAPHGAETGDFVTFSGVAPTVGGFDSATAAAINQEYVVRRISNVAFSFELRQENKTIKDITVNGEVDQDLFPFTSTVTTTTGGGSDTTAAFQINVGSNVSQLFNGWNANGWGLQAWGQTQAQASLRLWHHSTFGEDLILNYRDGAIYYWDSSNDVSNRAVALTDLPNANRVPTIAKQVLVSDRDRHVIAFGCDPEFDPGVQDPLIIRFSDSENVTDWETRAENTAGELRLGLGSQIVQAVETKQQILVFTDTTLYTMQFLGPPYTFGVSAVSEKITIQSPNAAVAVDDVVMWMGANEFYVYQGTVQRMPCTVRDYVFNDFNFDQAEKVIAGVNSEHSEIWWFYPSANFDGQGTYQNEDVDRYVIYNYQEQTWSVGTMNRTAWMDRGLFTFPIAAGTDGHLYEHERGFDDGEYDPARAIPAYIESSPFNIGEGDKFMMIKKLIPDITFKDSNATAPYVNLGLRTEQYPGTGDTALNSYSPWLTSPDSMTDLTALSILQASAFSAPDLALWGPTHQAIPGRILGDITNSGRQDRPYWGDAEAMNTYLAWKYYNNSSKPPADQIDYIENYMAPYMIARPSVFVNPVESYPTIIGKPLYDSTNTTSQIYRTYPLSGDFPLIPDNESFTDHVNVRLRGRSATFKVSSNELGVGWRLGTPKVEVRPNGRR